MVERGLFIDPGPPMLVSNQRAVLPCGCCVTVGVRTDLKEPSLGLYSCGEHDDLLRRFHLAFGDSLVNPSQRLLIDVVDEMLTTLASGTGPAGER